VFRKRGLKTAQDWASKTRFRNTGAYFAVADP